MIKILIIEDEIPAQKKLKRFIAELKDETELAAVINNVNAAIHFLKERTVDLIISDIELLDGNAFEIFKKVDVKCPIIFTTAYDHFWMDAFESNGISYLLKPFSKERFTGAWEKFMLLRNSSFNKNEQLSNLSQLIEENFSKKTFKKRFTVYQKQSLYFIEVEDILMFEANEGVVFALDTSGKKHLINELTLKEVETKLNPDDFFRINRGELVNRAFIEKVERYSKNTLAVKIRGHKKLLLTSQGKTALFREWVTQ
ncbi:LytR/AlgR family response regulator transcription factor [Flavobacterium sedimenticola]|uniref:LytTR family DNA-binding domain-containing protein n=1 Tax=Flavobacterium sedimenticola TaxID=3043286 RepID=A0ABT6XTH6_9FLAO|nr:LytTR family DNA-binding domain-containing protein [Flavobacterium sedimenticola]MDI9257914.1 LytTR family DNA-binding domain-containing protein [Flavobacterium sedimenticola]